MATRLASGLVSSASRTCSRCGASRSIRIFSTSPCPSAKTNWRGVSSRPVVVAGPRRKRAEHLLVADPGRHAQQPQRLRLSLLVVRPPDEHGVHQRGEPGHPQQVARELRSEQRPDVELARVAGQPVDEDLARRHLDRKWVSSTRRPCAGSGPRRRSSLGQPRRQVEQLDGERLGVRPLVPRAARARQRHALHGEHRQPAISRLRLPGVCRLVSGRQQRRPAEAVALLQEVCDHARVLPAVPGVPAQQVDDLAGVPVQRRLTPLWACPHHYNPGAVQPGDVEGSEPLARPAPAEGGAVASERSRRHVRSGSSSSAKACGARGATTR